MENLPHIQWIKVKDKLPDIYDFVLVFADNPGTNEPKPISIARLDNHFQWEFLGSSTPFDMGLGAYMDIEYDIDRNDITHWMKLPLPIGF